MFTSFTLKNFRCFRELQIEPLERINLIAGENNTGKTALLEAIFLHLGPNNPELTLRLNAWRGIEQSNVDAEEIWGWLFLGRHIDATIEILGMYSGRCGEQQNTLQIHLEEPEEARLVPNKETDQPSSISRSLTTAPSWRELAWKFQDTIGQSWTSRISLSSAGMKVSQAHLPPPPSGPGPLPGRFLTTRARFPKEDVECFSKLEQIGRQDEVLAPLKFLEPRLCRLAVLATSGVPFIHGDIGIGRLVPMPMMGEGIVRLFSMVLAIANAPGGTVLIDEIENGLHHSVLVPVWQALAQAARQANVQIFATTHSYECVMAAHEAFAADSIYDMRLHRLERAGEDIKVTTYDQESLDISLENNWEIR